MIDYNYLTSEISHLLFKTIERNVYLDFALFEDRNRSKDVRCTNKAKCTNEQDVKNKEKDKKN